MEILPVTGLYASGAEAAIDSRARLGVKYRLSPSATSVVLSKILPVFPATEVTEAEGGLIQARVPAPSVVKICPRVPSAAGKVKTVDVARTSGALKLRKLPLAASPSRNVFAVVPLPLMLIVCDEIVPLESIAAEPLMIPDVIASPETFPGVVIDASLESTIPAVDAILLSTMTPCPTSPNSI